MKKALSIALVLITMFNQVGANCLAVEASKPQKQVELQAKENVSQSDEELQRVVDQVLVELKKRAESKSDSSKKAEQSKSSLPVRALKTLFKPVYWVGKAGIFIVKQFLWLTFVALMSILGSVGTTYAIFKTGSAGIKVVNDSIEEMNKLIEHLKQNPQLEEDILLRMFALFSNCEKSMQPDEFRSYLKKVAMLFHPDKLKSLRNISKEDANKIYQLTTELMNKQ